MLTLDLTCDARKSELKFSPLGNGRYLLLVRDEEGNQLGLHISETQALNLYGLLRMYLRSPLSRWGPEALAAEAELRSAGA